MLWKYRGRIPSCVEYPLSTRNKRHSRRASSGARSWNVFPEYQILLIYRWKYGSTHLLEEPLVWLVESNTTIRILSLCKLSYTSSISRHPRLDISIAAAAIVSIDRVAERLSRDPCSCYMSMSNGHLSVYVAVEMKPEKVGSPG